MGDEAGSADINLALALAARKSGGPKLVQDGTVEMTLLMKKVGGLAFVLLGGLTAAHGGASGRLWELSVGLLIMAMGAVLLLAKVVRRNRTHP